MESRRTAVLISLNGQDITSDLEGDTISLTYNDNADKEADDIEVSIQNREKKWMKAWFPTKMDQLSVQILPKGWGASLDCGMFLLDDVGMSGRPLVVSMKGIAMPADQNFSEVSHNKTWEQATLRDIASTIAGNAGISVEYQTSTNPTLPFVSQTDENDKAFLYNLCEKFGVTMKMFSNKIIIYSLEELERQSTGIILSESQLLSWSFSDILTDTAYSGCQVSYLDKNGELQEYTENSSEDKAPKLYRHEVQVSNLGEAQQVAKAKLKSLNKGEVKANISLPGDTRMVSGIVVTLLEEDFGLLGGNYFIDKVCHKVGGGFQTSLDLHKIL